MVQAETSPETLAGSSREVFFERLYRSAFPSVARYISHRGGSLDDARDIFQDALIIYYEKTRDPGFRLQGARKAYILGIARHLWLRHTAAARDGEPLPEDLPADIAEYREPGYGRLLKLLETGGRQCMELLSAWYGERITMRELARRFGYRSERTATVRKFKCLEKLRHTVQHTSTSYEDLLD